MKPTSKYISSENRETANKIAKAFREENPAAIWKIARLLQLVTDSETLTQHDIATWLVKTNELLQSGAMVMGETRKRTAGGCFFFTVRKELRRIDTKKKKGLAQKEAWAIRKELGLLYRDYEQGIKRNANKRNDRNRYSARPNRYGATKMRPLR